MTPTRIQRRRIKGWRMPPNSVSVTRPGPFGNPFVVGKSINANGFTMDRLACVEAFREMVSSRSDWNEKLDFLRGKNLACYCPEGEPCHGDVLLELANRGR